MTTTIELRHFHLFVGLGGGARGFNRANPRVGNLQGRFRCIGGIDVDPAAVRDFERLAEEANVPSTALVAALLKTDLHRGSVFRRGHKYHWNPQFDAQHHQRLAEAARLLRANGFTVLKDSKP